MLSATDTRIRSLDMALEVATLVHAQILRHPERALDAQARAVTPIGRRSPD